MVVIIKAIKQKEQNKKPHRTKLQKRSDQLTRWGITHLHRIISISSHSSSSAFKEKKNLLNNAGKQKGKTMKAHQQNEPQIVSGSVP